MCQSQGIGSTVILNLMMTKIVFIEGIDSASLVSKFGYKCTQEEAKECFPQFRWVSLEEL